MPPPGRSAGTRQDLEQDHALEEWGLTRHRERSLTVRLAVRRQRREDRTSRNMCIRPSKYAGGFRATSELREATTPDPQFGPGKPAFSIVRRTCWHQYLIPSPTCGRDARTTILIRHLHFVVRQSRPHRIANPCGAGVPARTNSWTFVVRASPPAQKPKTIRAGGKQTAPPNLSGPLSVKKIDGRG